jgi:hypothetical protein
VEEGEFEDGNEHKVVGKKMDGFPDFGRAMLSEFGFEDGCKLILTSTNRYLLCKLMTRSQFQSWYIPISLPR